MIGIALIGVAVTGCMMILCLPTLCVAMVRGQTRAAIRLGLTIAMCATLVAALGCYLSSAAALLLVP